MKYTFLIISSILLCGISLRNCIASRSQKSSSEPLSEDYFFERLKAEKDRLKLEFEQQLGRLQTQRDSLENIICRNKNELKSQRLKTKVLSQRLIEAIPLPSDSTCKDSLAPIVHEYIEAQEQNDQFCDSTIYSLENLVANRDSSLMFQRQVNETQDQMLKDQQIRNQQLTEQLNTAFKMQKKKSRQNKILAGGIVIISGITTSILLLTKSL